MKSRTGVILVAAILGAATLGAFVTPSRAETVTVGITRLLGYAGVPVADARGYFKQEGIEIKMVEFHSAAPIGIAVASGDVQFGISGMSASFYNLASQGQLRIIASASGAHPGFYTLVAVASNKAWDAGLKSGKDLPGHDIAITQVGTSLHYSIGLLAKRYDFPMSAVRVKPLQSNPNVLSALKGGTIDAAIMPASPVLPLIAKGEIHRLGFIGQITDGFSGAMLFTGTKTANDDPSLVKRFVTAYRKGMRDFHDAFVGPDGSRKDGPLAPTIMAIMSKFTRVPEKQLAQAIPYLDAQGRVDEADIQRQIEWYKSQHLLKSEVKAKAIVDTRYALLAPPTS
jgi:NitT/TauT family transport system substrate-binding protein